MPKLYLCPYQQVRVYVQFKECRCSFGYSHFLDTSGVDQLSLDTLGYENCVQSVELVPCSEMVMLSRNQVRRPAHGSACETTCDDSLCTLSSQSWEMFFLTLLLLGNFPSALGDESESDINANSTVPHHHDNSTALELECTTSSASRNFSGCHSEEITKYRAVFIANAVGVISIGGPTNLITLLALPYVRLKYVPYLQIIIQYQKSQIMSKQMLTFSFQKAKLLTYLYRST